MAKKVVLFVDDEPNVLTGLQSRLHRQRHEWEMFFASSGLEALQIMERLEIDVIVSDMRMPQMDGATLLKIVKEKYPRTVRIVLSGHAEMATALRVIPVAHQFLSKPCEAGVIEKTMERSCALQSLIDEEDLKRIVGRIDHLPSMPRVYFQLLQLLSREKTTAEDVAQILKQDIAMCAKTLQIVNSAFFRLARTITKVEDAVVYLGFNTIKQVVLAVEVFSQDRVHTNASVPLLSLQTHAFRVGAFASSLETNQQQKEDAFIAGLLHDIGKLALVTELPDHFDGALDEMRAQNSTLHEAEKRLWGVTHAEVGGYLLSLWGLPHSIVEAVTNHHEPLRMFSPEFSVLTTTHLADGLINDAAEVLGHLPDRRGAGLDLEYLNRLDLIEKVANWRQQAITFLQQYSRIE